MSEFVGIEFVGEPKAIATPGSVLNHERDALWIKTRADNIPETITVDQSQVNADSPLTVADIPMPEGVVCIDDPETVVVSIATVAELPEGCSVRVAKGDHEAAGGSILGLMMLGAAKGDMIEIIVTGEDAEPVIENLAAMVEDGFGEP